MENIRLLDESTIIVTIKEGGVVVPVQDTTSRQIILKKPSGTTLTKSAVFLTNGSDGKVKYKMLPGEVNELKTWSVQAIVQWSDGRFASTIDSFDVESNL